MRMVRTDIERVDRQKGGMWLWLVQRLSAVFLLFGMMVHLIATHIFAIGELSYDNIGDRLQSVFFIVVDILLLGSVLFHGLNGARMVLLDYFFKERAQRSFLDAFLVAFGLAFFVYGVWALWPWITT
jgi:succinate dehydrogenase cytochrome b556 subunit